MPSRYLKQDRMFGWSAMVETYNTIDPNLVSDTASCPGIVTLLANAAVSYQENEKCQAMWLFKTSNFLEKVRNIVSAAVTIIVLAQNFVVDGALFFLSVLAQDKGMMHEKVKAMVAGLRSLVVKLLDYYRAMLRLLWDTLTMQEGVFKKISDLLKKMCNFARKMTILALDMADSFLRALKRVLPFVSKCPPPVCPRLLSACHAMNTDPLAQPARSLTLAWGWCVAWQIWAVRSATWAMPGTAGWRGTATS